MEELQLILLISVDINISRVCNMCNYYMGERQPLG